VDVSVDNRIVVEVAYALPERQTILEVEVPEGTTALEAARLSGIAVKFEGIDLENAKLGIFGKAVSPQQTLKAGDRVEIYRPLLADPKEVRKARAARVKERKAQEQAAQSSSASSSTAASASGASVGESEGR
jgi:putative ubiquitin-RnfH superfamily antitoxin RatB of RatAB toxin-antitoxin module